MNKNTFFESPDEEDSIHAYHSPLEKKINSIITPFQAYINHQGISSVLLLIATLAALTCASLPALSRLYSSFISTEIGFYIGTLTVGNSLHYWVNEVLLTLFFFFVGLEIKREFLVGELKNSKTATFIIFSAIGGMCVPALIYLCFNINTPYHTGWGIPMATDTAFALGILTCFRKKLSRGTFVLIAAIAIVDDIGSIAIITLFYAKHVHIDFLYPLVFLIAILLLINYAGIRRPIPYILIGLCIWYFTEQAGIHGTVSGIVVALLIPARPDTTPNKLLRKMKLLIGHLEEKQTKIKTVLSDHHQHTVLEKMQDVARQATTPLQHWGTKIELPISLIVLPLFAFTNAGLNVKLPLLNEVFRNPFSLGILFGLVIGKPIGIILFGQLIRWLKLGKYPGSVTFYETLAVAILAVAILAGIGFTMSLFITDLAFGKHYETAQLAKAAILLSAGISSILGMIIILFRRKKKTNTTFTDTPSSHLHSEQ